MTHFFRKSSTSFNYYIFKIYDALFCYKLLKFCYVFFSELLQKIILNFLKYSFLIYIEKLYRLAMVSVYWRSIKYLFQNLSTSRISPYSCSTNFFLDKIENSYKSFKTRFIRNFIKNSTTKSVIVNCVFFSFFRGIKSPQIQRQLDQPGIEPIALTPTSNLGEQLRIFCFDQPIAYGVFVVLVFTSENSLSF